MSPPWADVHALCAEWLAARSAITRERWSHEAPAALRHIAPNPHAAAELRADAGRLLAAADALAPLVAAWVAREEVGSAPVLPLCLRSDEALARAALRGELAAAWSAELARAALPWRTDDAQVGDEWTLLGLLAGEPPPDTAALASLRQRTARRATRDPEFGELRELALRRARAGRAPPPASVSASAQHTAPPTAADDVAAALPAVDVPPVPAPEPVDRAADTHAPIPVPADLPPALATAWEHLVRDGRIDGVSLDAWAGHPRWSRLFARELHRWGAQCGLEVETRFVNGARIFAARAAPVTR